MVRGAVGALGMATSASGDREQPPVSNNMHRRSMMNDREQIINGLHSWLHDVVIFAVILTKLFVETGLFDA
jgi:hypothetical protein